MTLGQSRQEGERGQRAGFLGCGRGAERGGAGDSATETHLRSGRAGGGRAVPPWAWPPLTAPRPGCQPHGSPTSLSLPAPRRRAVHARPACAPMAGKALSLLPPLLLAAAGLAGLLLLCVPTRDIREPPALKVHARAPGQPGAVRGGSDRAGPGCARVPAGTPGAPQPSRRGGVRAPQQRSGPGPGRCSGASGGRGAGGRGAGGRSAKISARCPRRGAVSERPTGSLSAPPRRPGRGRARAPSTLGLPRGLAQMGCDRRWAKGPLPNLAAGSHGAGAALAGPKKKLERTGPDSPPAPASLDLREPGLR